MIIAGVIFIVLIYTFYSSVRDKKKYLSSLKKSIQQNYGKKPERTDFDEELLNLYWKHICEAIPEDERIDDVTWNDLEMNELYRRINCCGSFAGEQALYAALRRLPSDPAYQGNLEHDLSYFAAQTKEREATQLLLVQLGKDKEGYHIPEMISRLDMFRIKGIWKYRMLQMLLALSVLPPLIFGNVALFSVTVCMFGVNLYFNTRCRNQHEGHFQSLHHMLNLVSAGVNIPEKNPVSGRTPSLEGSGSAMDHCAEMNRFSEMRVLTKRFEKISKTFAMLYQGKEMSMTGDFFGILTAYLLGATMWDILQYDRLVHQLNERKEAYMKLYRAIGEIDMLISVCSFRESLPIYCQPEFVPEHALKMADLYHPLIDQPVLNAMVLDRHCLINGSNASGKSTFIKAIAVSAILGQSINTCPARSLSMPYARVLTSMAVRDDLLAGESYFIKEIRYLHRIVQQLDNHRFMICVIDEILRGTNEEERIAASAAILAYLRSKNCLAVVATHDSKLIQLLGDPFSHYHFRERIEGRDVIFDYKVYNGSATTRNALRLLEVTGFPEEVVTQARAMVRSFET